MRTSKQLYWPQNCFLLIFLVLIFYLSLLFVVRSGQFGLRTKVHWPVQGKEAIRVTSMRTSKQLYWPQFVFCWFFFVVDFLSLFVVCCQVWPVRLKNFHWPVQGKEAIRVTSMTTSKQLYWPQNCFLLIFLLLIFYLSLLFVVRFGQFGLRTFIGQYREKKLLELLQWEHQSNSTGRRIVFCCWFFSSLCCLLSGLASSA